MLAYSASFLLQKGQLLPQKPCLVSVEDKLQQYLHNNNFYHLLGMSILSCK